MTDSPDIQTEPINVTRTLREFEGSEYIEDGYEFIGAGEAAGWRAIAAWGRDGWDLGDWPYVVYLFRGETERAHYCEGDITVETFASQEARERATDETALFYWRDEEWVTTRSAEDLSGPFSWERCEEVA